MSFLGPFLDPLTGVQLGDSRVFVKVGGIASLRDSLAAAFLAYELSGNVPVSSSAGLLNEARTRIKIMTDDEVVVFDLLRKLSAGQLYDVYVDHEVLVRTMVVAAEDEGDRSKCITLLRAMEDRGLLKESTGGWKAVR